MSIKQKFKDLLVTAIADEKFDATKVAHALSGGFDSAMLDRKSKRDHLAMDRLVEISDLLSKWDDRDTWEPPDAEDD